MFWAFLYRKLMAQLLHGSATQAVRGDLQRSMESLQVLAARYHINPKTVAKWRGCTSVSVDRSDALKRNTLWYYAVSELITL